MHSADTATTTAPAPSQPEVGSNTTPALVAYPVNPQRMAIVPASAKRGWMDDTDHSFANRCLPLLIANQWGWFILNERKIELIWNGRPRLADLHIHHRNLPRRADGQIDREKLNPVSHFGHGILTWHVPSLFQTPPGWNLYVRGPANWCKDGVCPLDGVVEADWSSMTFTMNWKVTRKDTWIAFEEGEPICQIFPIPRGSVEAFLPEIRALSNNPELESRYKAWKQSRIHFNRAQQETGDMSHWQKHYFRGTSILGEAFPDHQTKLTVREFRDAGSTASRSFATGCSQAFTTPVGPTHASPLLGAASARAPKGAGVDFQIVVSSENTPYMAWQTQLFCFSALTHVAKRPTVVVHRADGPLRPEFGTVKRWGCRIIEAPQFRAHPKGEYPPRNELGSLLTISALPEFRQGHVLFCEPDMLFVKRPEYSSGLAGEYYRYIDYSQERIMVVARKFGVADRLDELNRTSKIGVPYLVPGGFLTRVAKRWIEVLDAFEELDWIDIMYAFGLALAAEGLPAETTHMMVDNYDPLKRLDRSIVHYCYGDERWSKRAYVNGGSPLLTPPARIPKELSGTVLGEILHQIRQASACARFPRLFNAFRSVAAALPMNGSESHVR